MVVEQDEVFKIEIELRAFVSYGRPLAAACYFLESDAPVLPHAARLLQSVSVCLSSGSRVKIVLGLLSAHVIANLRDCHSVVDLGRSY